MEDMVRCSAAAITNNVRALAGPSNKLQRDRANRSDLHWWQLRDLPGLPEAA